MANIYNEPESTAVKITLKNNVYSYLNTNIGIAKICLITDQKKFGYSDLLGNLKKCLTDASGSSLTPKNCVFIADSEGSASHSTTFVYNDNKLGVNIEAPQNRAHFHEPSTGNCLIQITNASRGSSDDNDGMTIGIVGDDNVIRTTYGIPIKIQAEDPDSPGTFVDLATFQNIDSNSKNTILNTDLTVNIIPEKSTAASVFLTHEENTIKTRTAAQVRDDIGAAAVSHTLVSHTDWSTYFDQALKTTSTPTFAKLVLGTRPANDHRWTLALDQHNTLYSHPSATLNIMHNLYHDGSNWRYRYGSGSNSGGVVTTLAYNQFSVQVADSGIADQIATLTPAIFTNLNGNTAFGKNSFVGGNRLEVEGNTLVNGKTSTNKLNTGTFVRKSITTTNTVINLNSETTWNFRLNTNLTSSPKVYFSNAREGDEIFIVNESHSYTIELLAAYGSQGPNLFPREGLMLRCIGVDYDDYPVYAVVSNIWLGPAELKP